MKSRTVYFRFSVILLLSLVFTAIQYTTTNPWKMMNIPQNFLHYTLLFDSIGYGSQLYLLCLPFLACIGGSYLYSDNHISHLYPFSSTHLTLPTTSPLELSFFSFSFPPPPPPLYLASLPLPPPPPP
ncbi:hypothetical protein MMJ21_11185, partial [Enterococcus cecorum]|nr:hypothetical protein [Enterococcus cecorum]